MPRIPSSGIPGVQLSEQRNGDWIVRYRPDAYTNLGARKKSREDAIAWALEQRDELAKRRATGGTGTSFTELARRKAQRCRERGKSESHVRHMELLALAVEKAKLDDLRAPDWASRFESWLSGLNANWFHGLDPERNPKHRRNSNAKASRHTKDKLLREARAILRVGNLDLLAGIPSYLDAKDKQTVRDVFTIKDLRQLVRPAMESDPFWLSVALMVYTGARPVEASHLRWEWIDWEANTIDLKWYPSKDKPAFPLKTGERTIPLEPELRAILHARAKPHGWIIADEQMRTRGTTKDVDHAKELTHFQYTRPFYLYCRAAGVTRGDRVLYSVRHNWIALRLAMGWHDNMVMLWAGHRNMSTTLGYASTRERFRPQVETEGWGKRMYLRDAPPKAEPKKDEKPTAAVAQ